MVLGLTGGIGSGKSSASRVLSSMGMKVFDADIIARELLDTVDIQRKIIQKLGSEFIDKKNKKIDRQLLKKTVFNNSDMLKILNGIVHPSVIKKYRQLYKKYSQKKEIVIFDIPLLFETSMDIYCNLVLVIDIEKNIQINRIQKRDKVEIELINNIILNQMSREKRNSCADIIITNNGTLNELKNNIKKIIVDIKRGKYESNSASR